MAIFKRSVATDRDKPLEKTVTATSSQLYLLAEMIEVETTSRTELIDLTSTVSTFVRRSGIKEGTLSLWSMHTTCSVFINESQKALESDILAFLEHSVAQQKYYKHNDPAHSDCDRQNAASHLRAMLLGHSLTMQISGGELVLGQWQRVMCAELDGPRTRTIRAQVLGMVGS
ncbi:MAG TPA: secondary thiamine-phosphate synthase enzyme YjbQ [Vicinamibacterales bacterium]